MLLALWWYFWTLFPAVPVTPHMVRIIGETFTPAAILADACAAPALHDTAFGSYDLIDLDLVTS